MLKWNKKANLKDIFTTYKDISYFVVFFGIFGAIVLAMGVLIKASVLAPYLTGGFENYFTNFGSYYDYVVYVIYAAGLMFSILAAQKIPTNSFYFVLAQAALVFIWATVFILQELMTRVMQQAILTNIVAQFQGTLFFINNTYIFLFIYTVAVLWALYNGKSE